MKRQCIWCHAVQDPDIVVKTLEDLDRFLGPIGCSAPDGDGHLWVEISDEEYQRIIERSTEEP